MRIDKYNDDIINPYNNCNKLITIDNIKNIFKKFDLIIEPININYYINALTHKSYIKKEYYPNKSILNSVDSQQVSSGYAQDEKGIITINKQNSTKNQLNSEEVGVIEEDKLFLKHTIKKGETLFRIAVNYNVSVSELWSWNNLKSTIVEKGTVLKIKQ